MVFYLCWIYWSPNSLSMWTLRSLSSTLLLLAQSTGQQQCEYTVVFHREEFFPIISSDGEAEGTIGTVMSGWQWVKNTSPHLQAHRSTKREKKEELCSMEKACLSWPWIPFIYNPNSRNVGTFLNLNKMKAKRIQITRANILFTIEHR